MGIQIEEKHFKVLKGLSDNIGADNFYCTGGLSFLAWGLDVGRPIGDLDFVIEDEQLIREKYESIEFFHYGESDEPTNIANLSTLGVKKALLDSLQQIKTLPEPKLNFLQSTIQSIKCDFFIDKTVAEKKYISKTVVCGDETLLLNFLHPKYAMEAKQSYIEDYMKLIERNMLSLKGKDNLKKHLSDIAIYLDWMNNEIKY